MCGFFTSPQSLKLYYSATLFVATIVSASLPAGATVDNSWSQFHGGNSFAGSATTGPDLRIHSTPRFEVGSGLGAGFGANSSSPVVMNNKVFAYTQSGEVTAFSEFNGAELWSASIDPASFGSWSSPSADVTSNSVFMGSGSYVYRLDANTGDELWAFQMTEYGGTGETYAQVVNAAPTIVSGVPGIGLNGEGLVFQHTYGSFGGGTRLHAINVADGSLAWFYDTPGQGQGEVAYNPSNGLIYAVTNGQGTWAEGRGGIIALDAATGDVEWNSVDSYDAYSFGGIAYDAANNRVVAGGYSFYDYAGMLVVDGDTGATVSYTGDALAPSGDYRPTIGDDNLIYISGAEFQDGPFVFAFDALTGLEVWQSDLGWGNWTHSVTYAADIGDGTDVVYSSNQSGTLHGMLDADTGDLLTSVAWGGGPAAIANDNLYFLTSAGQLVAFGPAIPEPTSMMLVGAAAMLLVVTRRRKEVPALVLLGVVYLASSQTYANSPYATELISQNAAYGNQPLYNDPNAVLGEPTSLAVNAAFPPVGDAPFHIKMVEPAYNLDADGKKVITTLSRKPGSGPNGYEYGSITVKFDHQLYDDPVNPYGIDLNVFGNAFYVGAGTEGGYVSDTTDMRAYYLAGGIFAEPVVISVSPDNVNWYTYGDGPYGDTDFPTQGYQWDVEQHQLTENGWTEQKMDFTKPVNPTLGTILGAAGPTIHVTDALQMYDRSGGGTGIDLAESGFEWIQYLRVESTAQFRDGEIDAFADVRPMQVGDSLSITPENVDDGTLLYFQNELHSTQTAILAEFTEIANLGKLATQEITDEDALALFPDGVLASCQLDVTMLVGDTAVDFTADFHLQPGHDYTGDGSELSVLSWSVDQWLSIPFAFDATTGMVTLEDWSQSLSLLAITQDTGLSGDFDGDGDVDGFDFLAWQRGESPSPLSADDLANWQANYGQTSIPLSMAVAVPEPATLVLGLASCLAFTFCPLDRES